MSKGIRLERLSIELADDLFQLTESNRAYLREWLPWLDAVRKSADTATFIDGCIAQFESGRGPQYAIFCDQSLCGVAGFHNLSVDGRTGAVGYWLAEPFAGRGIMTEAVRKVVRVGFDDYGLRTIEVHCAVENFRSRTIAERVGGRLNRIAKDAEWLYDHYVDHAIYVIEPVQEEALSL